MKISAEHFLNKITVFFGPTQSGKTTLMLDVLSSLVPHVAFCLLISPTESSNHSFQGIIDESLIYRDLFERNINRKSTDRDPEIIKELMTRQEMITSIYELTKNYHKLKELMNFLPDSARVMFSQKLEQARSKKNQKILEYQNQINDKNKIENLIKTLNKSFKNFEIKLMETYLKHLDHRSTPNLTDEQVIILKNIGINPRVVLILEDCGDSLKKTSYSETMKKLFYTGRHKHITTFVSCQSVNNITDDMRENIHLTIFSTHEALVHFFKLMRSISREKMQDIQHLSIIYENGNYQRVVWNRYLNQFSFLSAKILSEKIKIGNQALSRYFSEVKTDNSLNSNNKYYEKFIA